MKGSEEKTYSVIICDDESYHVDYLEQMLNNMFDCFTAIKCSDSDTLLELVKINDVDAVFLDINMKVYNGIECGKELRQSFPHLKIIYVSGYPEYVEDVFQTEPSYFIIKPVTEEKLKRAVDCVFRFDKLPVNKLEIKCRGQITFLEYQDILYIESSKRLAKIKCINGEEYNIYKKLSELESDLPGEFVRCHQSFIVNLAYVKSLSANKFILKSNEEIPISQRKTGKVREQFYSYLKKDI